MTTARADTANGVRWRALLRGALYALAAFALVLLILVLVGVGTGGGVHVVPPSVVGR